jgi:dTDP-4-dehydrorhamnose 3,5-epimerase
LKIIKTNLPEVLIFEPDVFEDSRGQFLETWSKVRYEQGGISLEFMQDNVSYSCKGTLRGLHFQHPHGQGKLVQVLAGEVFDVVVDIRVGSSTFGETSSVTLSGEDHKQMYVPPGYAHGFCVVSENAVFSYKCTDYYESSCEAGVLWNDPDLGIKWPIENPLLSEKDTNYCWLKDIDPSLLPCFEKI